MTHVPVLSDEVLQMFHEIEGGVSKFLDATFGRGGHTRRVLDEFSEVRVIALDKDLAAIHFGLANFKNETSSGRLKLVHADYTSVSENKDVGGMAPFDGILLDLGVSSPQLDSAERGFSFMLDGPLDMRMDQTQNFKASDIVNSWSEEELIRLFRSYGEVARPNRVVRAIVNDREMAPFETTKPLAELIARIEGWRKTGLHPATQYFMALRIQVNNELENLDSALKDIVQLLREGGRLLVITFHSLEDRIAKQTLQSFQSFGRLINKKVITPSELELNKNPRSRSAKLRVFERNLQNAGPRLKKNKYANLRESI